MDERKNTKQDKAGKPSTLSSSWKVCFNILKLSHSLRIHLQTCLRSSKFYISSNHRYIFFSFHIFSREAQLFLSFRIKNLPLGLSRFLTQATRKRAWNRGTLIARSSIFRFNEQRTVSVERVDNLDGKGERRAKWNFRLFHLCSPRGSSHFDPPFFLFFFFSEISHSWFASSTSSRAFNVNFMPDSFLLEGESLRGNSKGEEKLFPRFSPPVYPNLRWI